jgi:hypothetical protein
LDHAQSAIVSGSVYNAKSALLQVFSEGALGTAEDKMRLFVIYYLCNPQIRYGQHPLIEIWV